MYTDLVRNFENKPRDIHTVPLNRRAPVWFYVFVMDGCLYIDTAKEHTPSSTISKPRQLAEREYDNMLALYHRRKSGASVYEEALIATHNQVYWYGIFADLKM